MSRTVINTPNAPQAIGTYSQAVKVGSTVYISGQIPLVPSTMEVISQDFAEQTQQVSGEQQGTGGEGEAFQHGVIPDGGKNRSTTSGDRLFAIVRLDQLDENLCGRTQRFVGVGVEIEQRAAHAALDQR